MKFLALVVATLALLWADVRALVLSPVVAIAALAT
jgi:hypothetical protein